MDKTITFKARLQDEEFNRDLERIQRKFKEMQQGTSQGTSQGIRQAGPSQASPQSAQAYSTAVGNVNREIERSLREQSLAQEKLTKAIVSQHNELKGLEGRHRRQIEGTKEELKLKEKIAQTQADLHQKTQDFNRDELKFNQLLEARESGRQSRQKGSLDLGRRYAAQGMNAAAQRESGRVPTKDYLADMGVTPGGIAGIFGAAVSAVRLGEHVSRFGLRLEEAKGTAMEAMPGRDLGRMYSGKSPFDAYWAKERGQAAGMAEDVASRQTILDTVKMTVATAGTLFFVAGALSQNKGMKATGMVIGAAAAAYGLYDDKTRSLIFNDKEGYKQLLEAQQAKDTMSAWENLKSQNQPVKKALERLETDYMPNVQLQRTLGLSSQQFYGEDGLLHRGKQFGIDQTMGMAGDIVGAGGSARMGNKAELGLQMQRMGITNAAKILGTLSGGLQSTESSESAVVSIISKSFQIGLDNTKFAEEQRRFTQATAEIISRTGTVREDDQDRLAGLLGRFVGEKTNVGIQAAQGAYEKFQERSSQVGGRRGVMRMMGAIQDPFLGKLDPNMRSELLNLRDEQLNPDDERMQYYAAQAGTSPEDLIKRVRGINKDSRYLIPGSKEAVAGFEGTISRYMFNEHITKAELNERFAQRRKGLTSVLPPEVFQAMGGIEFRQGMEEGPNMSTPEARAMAQEGIGGEPSPDTFKKMTEGKLGGVGDRFEDRIIAAGAEGMDQFRQVVAKLLPDLQELTKQTKEWHSSVLAQTKQRLDNEKGKEVFFGRPDNADLPGLGFLDLLPDLLPDTVGRSK